MKKILLLSLLFINPSFAEMMCDDATDYFAIYEIDSYTCNPGEYLPANTVGCVSCPNGFVCNGGTYNFNPDYFQGINFDPSNISTNTINNICAANFPNELFAVYEPNQHTCSPGYYLPAGVDSCTICPQNNKCIGGTYLFNETTNQGIESCPDKTFAPGGTSYCYEHILHIGDDVVFLKSTKLTTPSLNVGMDDGIFYANMTTTPTRMNNATERYLKIEYDGVVYYVCDDSTYTR